MSGPFPGMDPYLEDPKHWPGAHNALITYMVAELNRVLPPEYVAGAEERCYVTRPEQAIRPDIAVRETVYPTGVSQANVAVASASDPAVVYRVYAMEEREAYIDIIHLGDRERVVTTIELFSHTNKTTRNEGRRLYRRKQRDILASQTHLIEIDLLLAGQHTVAIPKAVFQPQDRYDYLICLHRAGQEAEFEVWFNTLAQRLPHIAVPLDAGIPDATLDLQAVLDRTYEDGAYLRKIDYTQPPVPPVSPEDAEWASRLLQGHGLRPL